MKFVSQPVVRTILAVGLITAASAVGCGGDDEEATPISDGDGDGDGEGTGGVTGGDGDGDDTSTGGDASGDGDGDASMGGDGGAGGEGNSSSGGSTNIEAADDYCQSDKSCRDADQICDMGRSICVDCVTDSDCLDGSLCRQFRCEAVTVCETSKTCSANEVCSDELGYCVECVGDNDCLEGSVCSESSCRLNCDSDKDCRDAGEVCNADAGICVDCIDDADCGDMEYCGETNVCQEVACSPGSRGCSGDELLTCTERGDAFEARECNEGCDPERLACEGTADCSEGDEGCSCSPGGTCRDSLACEGGICVDDGRGEGECAGATGNLCGELHRFSGTQVVDGVGDEFCRIPGQVVTFETAAFKNERTESPDTSSVEAYVRVAWDAHALRAHIHVQDPIVAHTGGEWHDGDNVQFFFSPEAPARGSIYDNDAVQFAVMPSWGSGDHYLNTDEPGTLTTASRLVEGGYEVEVRWEWEGDGRDFNDGDTIGLNFQLGAQQGESGRDFEFALALENPGDTTCDGDAVPWCDAGLWCSTTLSN